jgi:hypothetical protein
MKLIRDVHQFGVSQLVEKNCCFEILAGHDGKLRRH